MSETTPKATDTLVARAITVSVGGEDYVVKSFCFAKTVRVFQLLSEMAAAAGIEQVVDAAAESDEAGEFEGGVATSFISRLLKLMPKLLAEGVPTVYKLLGLIVTGNKELRDLEKADGVDVDSVLLARGEDIAYADDGTVEEVLTLISSAVQVMGVETVVKALGPMVRTLMMRR